MPLVNRHGTDGLAHPAAPPVLAASLQRSLDHKHSSQGQVPWEHLRESAHAIKAHAIANLDILLVEFERQFTARGGIVLWASTAAEAADHFLSIAKQHGADAVVKGKSMLSEELRLNERLAREGIEPIETDLGEFIVQLAGQKPTHVIAPAIHLSRSDVGRLFRDKLGIAYTDDPAVLSMTARAYLRRRYLNAGVGMTGVNFAIAETGTTVVVENEGNGALSAAVPPVHVLVMGIEKIVRSFDDVQVLLHVLARAGTGQKLSTYTHFFLGPETGRAMYCIAVDAGRSALLADARTRQSLYCIRCGACMNVCPVYRLAGGAAYGTVYPGPIGSVISPYLEHSRESAQLPFASSLCGACGEECPVKIDLPHQLVYLRSRAVAAGNAGSPAERRQFHALFAALSDPVRYRRATRLARTLQKLAQLSLWRPRLLRAWARHRVLPEIASTTFKEWWERRP